MRNLVCDELSSIAGAVSVYTFEYEILVMLDSSEESINLNGLQLNGNGIIISGLQNNSYDCTPQGSTYFEPSN